jgi:hypothetical protein
VRPSLQNQKAGQRVAVDFFSANESTARILKLMRAQFVKVAGAPEGFL